MSLRKMRSQLGTLKRARENINAEISARYSYVRGRSDAWRDSQVEKEYSKMTDILVETVWGLDDAIEKLEKYFNDEQD